MEYTIKIPLDKATEEVERLFAIKKILPKRREELTASSEYLIEGVSLGFVTIADDGKITQTLIEPVGSLTKLDYVPRVSASTVQSELGKITNMTVAAKTLLYIRLYTGLLATQINMLEPADRNIADAIALFFM